MKNLGYYIEPDNYLNSIVIDEDIDISNILFKVKNFEECMEDITKKRDALKHEMSIIDSEIEDILHAAEFYNLNACEGYKLYKMLHECRVKRRKIKDYIEVVGYIENITGKEFAAETGSKSILGKMKREYRPRVLNELFNR